LSPQEVNEKTKNKEQVNIADQIKF